jgi:signal peptidase I
VSFNLALVLTLLTAVSGVVILLEKFVWKRGASDSPETGALDTLIEYSRSFFPVLLFVLVVRSFVFEPFRIPSGSMMPTLLQGDFIFVKKFSYGLRLPVTETKVVETGEPERGDVIVFRLPSDPNINYIKRVIGLPGDSIVYENHRLTINGELVDLQKAGDFTNESPVFVEKLGDDSHDILITTPRYRINEGRYEVPVGHYFVMGDNRDNSKDSRFIGAIPETHLVGEAVRIWMHMDGFSMPRWDRIGMKIE